MKKIRHILALFLVPLVACTDWFDAVPDNGTIPDKKFFGDENAFYNALIDVYTQLRSNDLYGENLTLGIYESGLYSLRHTEHRHQQIPLRYARK